MKHIRGSIEESRSFIGSRYSYKLNPRYKLQGYVSLMFHKYGCTFELYIYVLY